MTLPKTVTIGPFKCSVVCTEYAIEKASLEEGVELDGQWQPRSQVIVIRPGMAADQEAETLVHEVLHGLMEMIGAELEVPLEIDREGLVTKLSPVLLDTLRRNPQMVRYLVGQ